jgi:hypothetical protein
MSYKDGSYSELFQLLMILGASLWELTYCISITFWEYVKFIKFKQSSFRYEWVIFYNIQVKWLNLVKEYILSKKS